MEFKKPCSLYISDLDQDKNSFSCSQCRQNVYDLRGLKANEIKEIVEPGMCIIADGHEVTTKQRFSFGSLSHSIMVLLCAVGLSSSHAHSQTEMDTTKMKITEKSKPLKPSHSEQDKLTKKYLRKKRRAHKKSKKHKTYIMGCPSF